MTEKRAFTLIELLVVISVIALLMSILLPALRRVKKQAKAVVCKSNLKQWGTIFAIYANDNNGKFMKGWPDNLGSTDPNDWRRATWMDVLRSYYGNSAKVKKNDLRLCPIATKPINPPGTMLDPISIGGALRAWGIFDDSPIYSWVTPGDYGSYGINGWVYDYPLPDPKEWRGPNVKGTCNIPLFLDSLWMSSWPEADGGPPPVENYHADLLNRCRMYLYCMNRHDCGINGVFLDYSVKKIGLKQLWKLKWYRQFDTNGPWTQAHDPPPIWPEWMRKFKDY